METLIPLLAIGGGLATAIIITCTALFFDHKKQVMRNQERMAAIEKGIPVPDLSRDDGGASPCRNSLYKGIKHIFIGAGLALALYVTIDEKWAVWGAFIAIIGLGNLVYWIFVERNQTGHQGGSTGG